MDVLTTEGALVMPSHTTVSSNPMRKVTPARPVNRRDKGERQLLTDMEGSFVVQQIGLL